MKKIARDACVDICCFTVRVLRAKSKVLRQGHIRLGSSEKGWMLDIEQCAFERICQES